MQHRGEPPGTHEIPPPVEQPYLRLNTDLGLWMESVLRCATLGRTLPGGEFGWGGTSAKR